MNSNQKDEMIGGEIFIGGELLLFGGYGGGSRVAFSSSAMSKKKRALHL